MFQGWWFAGAQVTFQLLLRFPRLPFSGCYFPLFQGTGTSISRQEAVEPSRLTVYSRFRYTGY